ncbi:MAG: hypothetical protein VX519_08990 [Myxococcota bacterium]|nr:hypothetical protein [Myxococcota bacterium]
MAYPEQPDRLREAAEQVRAHLVQLRGGAPFLSPVDSRLLLEWLEAGIPVALILRTLEKVAAQRAAKRTRAPLTLNALKRTLKKEVKHEAKPEECTSLSTLVSALRTSSDTQERAIAEEFAGMTEQGEALVEQALDAARRFFDRKLEEADREQLTAVAEAELADLKDVFSAQQWERAVEQAIRQNLRESHPLLSASSIWDTVFP